LTIDGALFVGRGVRVTFHDSDCCAVIAIVYAAITAPTSDQPLVTQAP
jgi:hypothetical protein